MKYRTVNEVWEEMEFDFEGDKKIAIVDANDNVIIEQFVAMTGISGNYLDLLVLDKYIIDDGLIVLEVIDERDLFGTWRA